ncbi:MAG: lycopene elongase [Halobacteriales archaeon SW_8_66_22]|nr:MAG: lycopene elongase [Halobacteriales archaeon SW_8_66_22]
MTDVAGRLSSLTPSERTLPGYLFWLSRPRFWLYLAGPVIVGVVYGAAGPGDVVQLITVALFAYFLLPANLFLYGINDIFDADIDALNPKKAEDGREVQYTGSRAVAAVVASATLLGAAFVPFLPRTALLPFAGFYLLGVAYSAPPLRFKTTPFLDSLSNGLYVLPALVAYATLTGSFPPTLLGERRTLAYCGACWLAAAGLMTWLHPFLGGVFAVYLLFVAGIVAGSVAVSRAYWWFPAVNTLAGMVLTLGGIWGLIHG